MTRFYGAVGFAEQIETAPGVWQEKITERHYKGDVTRNQIRWNQGSEMNDDLRVDNEISIIPDPFFEIHMPTIRYVTWMGSKWKVTSFMMRPPRVVLQIGGPYHER